MIEKEEPKNYTGTTKLLKTLNKRSAISQNQKHHKKSYWPTSMSFSLLNKTQAIMNKLCQKKISYRKTTNYFKKSIKPEVLLATVSVQNLQRSITISNKPQTPISNTHKKDTRLQSAKLFNLVKQQRIARLQEEKQELLNNIFHLQKPIIHRIEEDEEAFNKSNSINLKTYFSLNRLMDLRDQIYHTANYRPKTGCQRLKKKKLSTHIL